jgi:ribose 5-phosphate isomerase B
MKIAIGSDHGGFELKRALKSHLVDLHHDVIDVGCNSTAAVDYPDYAKAVAGKITSGDVETGVMIDGAGVGSTMTANKIRGIRAALCNDLFCARNAREHNNANMLVMGSMVVGPGKAKQILDTFTSTEFQGGRHQRRVDKIDELDDSSPDGPISKSPDIREIVRSVVNTLAD